MGIYDREYYREGPSFLGRLAGQGSVTLWLVGLNVALFLLQLLSQTGRGVSPVTDWLILDVNDLLRGQVWRLLTYAFLHASFWHLLGNMLFLFFFGRQVEEELGAREFLLFYLAAAVLAGLAFVAADTLFLRPFWLPSTRYFGSVLGASGGVMAVLVVAACTHPRQVIYLMFVLPVPIWAVVGIFVLVDLFGLLGQQENGVATAAHLGGAAFGLLYYRFGWRLAGLLAWPPIARRSRPRLRLYREEDDDDLPPRPAPSPRLDDEHLEAQVDAILAKVSRVGMDGLSDQERQVLLRASEAIKRRRG